MAEKLLEALQRASDTLQRHPEIGSPALGRELGVDGLRAWPVDGFPLSLWYFVRADHVDVVRLVGQRQDALRIELD